MIRAITRRAGIIARELGSIALLAAFGCLALSLFVDPGEPRPDPEPFPLDP